jgi:N-acylglucosamine 2-epimerase
MQRLGFQQLHALYDDLLRHNIIPYWFRHAIDREHGGLFTCINDDGSRNSTDKYMWSQCRAIWTFAAYYNRFEPRPEFLDVARATAEFVLKHGRDEQGRYVFKVTREGKHLEGATSIYTDFFAAYGLGELYRATKEGRYLDEALTTFRSCIQRVQSPDFDGFAPYKRPEGIKYVHGIPMIGLETGQELADVAPEKDILAFIDWCLGRIMNHHRRPELRTHLEHLGPNSEVVDTPAGRCANPGHSIESMWFVIHQARRRKDAGLIKQAVETIHWMIEFGWDRKKGGIPHCRDFKNPDGPCWWPAPDTKPWWIVGEAMYALLLSYELTREPWCLDWYWKVHQWSFAHYPDREHGEWHQRLDHDGNVMTKVIALPVKDPFHLPRNVLGMLDVLERLKSEA